tara:strand:+ start:16 stop:306 length:291 start_codon:yes stop_codon:yes gene_type:complete
MINNSVSKAYSTINDLSMQVEKAESEGIPKDVKQNNKMNNKKGLLTRSREMFKYNETSTKTDDIDKEQQKLVIAYVLHIRKAFQEVKNGRTTNTKS